MSHYTAQANLRLTVRLTVLLSLLLQMLIGRYVPPCPTSSISCEEEMRSSCSHAMCSLPNIRPVIQKTLETVSVAIPLSGKRGEGRLNFYLVWWPWLHFLLWLRTGVSGMQIWTWWKRGDLHCLGDPLSSADVWWAHSEWVATQCSCWLIILKANSLS